MSLFDAKIQDLSESDLQSLIITQVSESRVIDYKRDAIGTADRDKQEFLADVASFANAAGGHLVIGIDEIDGLPVAIPGIPNNPDSEILRLEQMLRTGIRPVIQGVETRAVRLSNGQAVLVIRIPRSWTSPHQVGPVGSYRIFGRGSNGKYQLDVQELRTLFQLGPEIGERIRLLRAERLGRIISNDLNVRLVDCAKIVLHFVPMPSFASRTPIDLTPISRNRGLLTDFLGSGGSARVNVDGWFAYSEVSGGLTENYAQIFRDGTIEVVTSRAEWEVRGQLYLTGQSFDEEIQAQIGALRRICLACGIEAPISALLTLVGMKNWRMGADQHRLGSQPTFDRDPLLCPDILMDSLALSDATLARPISDVAWNAAGFERSINYDQQGNWAPGR